jgi:DNA-binding beta-propeller fold protein YncE
MTISVAGNTTAALIDAVGTHARFSAPVGVAFDAKGTIMYVSDTGNHVIRAIDMYTRSVTRVAGGAGAGAGAFADASGTSAGFNQPAGLAVDASAVFMYVADSLNHRVRKVTIATGAVATLVGSGTAGTADATGAAAAFNSPWAVALDPDAFMLYVADTLNHRVRRVEVATGVVTTFAGAMPGHVDDMGTAASFDTPRGLVVDPSGRMVFVADTGNFRVRAIEISSRSVTTLAGSTAGFMDGLGVAASFRAPESIAIDPSGRFLFVADCTSNRVRLIDVTNANVTTLAGAGIADLADGVGVRAAFSRPRGVAVDVAGRFLAVADAGNNVLRVVQTTTPCPGGRFCARGLVAGYAPEGTYILSGASSASNGELCPASAFCYAGASTASGNGQCKAGYFCATGSANSFGGKLNPAGRPVRTLAGSDVKGRADDAGTSASFSLPTAVVLDANATSLYLTDNEMCLIRVLRVATGAVTTLAGSGTCTADTPDTTPPGAAPFNAIGQAASFGTPAGLAVDANSTVLYIADAYNNCVRNMSLATYAVGTLVGSNTGVAGSTNGVGTAATFDSPRGVALHPVASRRLLYVSDTNGHRIRIVNLTSAAVITLVGSSAGSADGTSTDATFNLPHGIVVDPTGVALYVADSGNHCLRRVALATGAVTTLAGDALTTGGGWRDGVGTNALFATPTSVAVDAGGAYVYVADTGNNRLRRLVLISGLVSTLAGSGAPAFVDDLGLLAAFATPSGIAVDPHAQNLYVADTDNNRVRLVSLYTASPCPPGTYCAASAAEATACLASFYCPLESQPQPLPLCPAGAYCAAGVSAGVPCPSGYFCPPAVAGPLAALRGSFSNTTGLSAAWPCTPGRYCSGILARAPDADACVAGYYCPAASTSPTQAPCPAGSFSNTTGVTAASACTPCTSGQFCASTALTAASGSCDAGFFCAPGSAAPVACAAGKWSAAVGATAASVCAACTVPGTYCLAGSTSPLGLNWYSFLR